MVFTPTVLKFISTAFVPVGHTMYIYGGGWDPSDTKSGIETRVIGESGTWKTFFKLQSSSYNYKNFLHCSALGLDCTGYIGWVIYNTLNSKNGNEGFVYRSDILGYALEKRGLGIVTNEKDYFSHRCGDIFFSKKHHHAYISLGLCDDGSALILHSSPPGVMLSGTASKKKGESIAQKIATDFMHDFYPQWSIKFPDSNRGIDYLSDYLCFRFYNVILPDPEGITLLNPRQILLNLKRFREAKAL